jgi:hypothetical protein
MVNDEDITEQIYGGNIDTITSIQELNTNLNNKYDYIIYEHCPLEPNVNYVKYYNMLKPNGYLIYFSSYSYDDNGNIISNEMMIDNKVKLQCESFNTIFKRINSLIFQKKNDNIFNIVDVIDEFIKYQYQFNPKKLMTGAGNYKYITNPVTNTKVAIKSKLGMQILNKYSKIIQKID